MDVIKVAIDNDITLAELTAIVDEAHRHHLKVAAPLLRSISKSFWAPSMAMS